MYAAKIPPKVRIAQLSSATEATPVLKLFPGIEYGIHFSQNLFLSRLL